MNAKTKKMLIYGGAAVAAIVVIVAINKNMKKQRALAAGTTDANDTGTFFGINTGGNFWGKVFG